MDKALIIEDEVDYIFKNGKKKGREEDLSRSIRAGI